MSEVKKHVTMYSDGSAIKQIKDKKKYHGGAGVVLIYNGKEKHLSIPIEDGTNNISELLAPTFGLEALKESCQVTIFTDSMYCINVMTSWVHGWERRGWKTQNKGDVKNKEIIQRLQRACKRHNVEWIHVKGHSGDKYNTIADELACKASASLKEIEESKIER